MRVSWGSIFLTGLVMQTFEVALVICLQSSSYTGSPGLQYVMKIVESQRCVGQRELEMNTKNFASDECGAKIVGYSGDVKHPEHVINRNQDQYLLTPCDKKGSYFIIELCDNVKLSHVELESFELYSGTPSTFSVYTSDKLTDNLESWEKFGSFHARSNKMERQSFSSSHSHHFARFVRIELETFHGSELICTLSSFR